MITKLKKLLKRIAHKIEEFDKEGDSYLYTAYKGAARPHNWYVGGTLPYPLWFTRKLEKEMGPQPELREADYVLDDRWRDLPYSGRDLRTMPDWDIEKRGAWQAVWWVVVVLFTGLVFGGIVWGLMNRVGA